MQSRNSEGGQGSKVRFGAVAGVALPAVAAEAAGKAAHPAVAGDLGHDRGGSNGEALAVATDDGRLWLSQLGDAQAIDEYVLDWPYPSKGSLHSQGSGDSNIEPVDFADRGTADADAEGGALNLLEEPFACRTVEQFGIADTCQVAAIDLDREDDGSGNDATSKCPTAHFIDSREPNDATTPEATLDFEGGGDVILQGSTLRPARLTGLLQARALLQ